jgi:hypothetical protein
LFVAAFAQRRIKLFVDADECDLVDARHADECGLQLCDLAG